MICSPAHQPGAISGHLPSLAYNMGRWFGLKVLDIDFRAAGFAGDKGDLCILGRERSSPLLKFVLQEGHQLATLDVSDPNTFYFVTDTVIERDEASIP